MRRKRKRTGTWLPMLGTIQEDPLENSAYTFIVVDVPIDGSPGMGIVPLTYDYPQESPALSASADTLAEIVGSEYIIQRIVGNLLANNICQLDTSAFGNYYEGLLFTAGFFVARAGSENQLPLGENAPIGYGATGGDIANLENYSPENPATVREPWMWRRTWILGNERWKTSQMQVGYLQSLGFSAYPPTTAHYGSLRDGPQIDIKSRRHVRQDERLFFVATARGLPLNSAASGGGQVFLTLQCRIFGNLVKARQRGAF